MQLAKFISSTKTRAINYKRQDSMQRSVSDITGKIILYEEISRKRINFVV